MLTGRENKLPTNDLIMACASYRARPGEERAGRTHDDHIVIRMLRADAIECTRRIRPRFSMLPRELHARARLPTLEQAGPVHTLSGMTSTRPEPSIPFKAASMDSRHAAVEEKEREGRRHWREEGPLDGGMARARAAGSCVMVVDQHDEQATRSQCGRTVHNNGYSTAYTLYTLRTSDFMHPEQEEHATTTERYEHPMKKECGVAALSNSPA